MRLIFGLIVVVTLTTVGFKIVNYFYSNTFTATVSGKERITKSNGDQIESFYLVYTDKGTIKLEDDILRGNWSSSDVYGSLKNDSTYTFTTSGFRNGFFSMYPNIIKINK
jgi:hypothetical protein